MAGNPAKPSQRRPSPAAERIGEAVAFEYSSWLGAMPVLVICGLVAWLLSWSLNRVILLLLGLSLVYRAALWLVQKLRARYSS